MGAIFYFDELVPVPEGQRPKVALENRRRLEVFSHGQEMYVRMGPVGERSGEPDYTVTLDMPTMKKLIEGLNGLAQYFGADMG
jgi:hypothetical protein